MMLYFHPPSLSTVIFATATVLAFVLLHNSSFNFHCYTQREATPTQKLARKCAATSRDFFAERLQSAFTLANQLRWITQYISMHKDSITTCKIINQTQQSKKKKKKNCSILYTLFDYDQRLCSINKILGRLDHTNYSLLWSYDRCRLCPVK